MKTRIQATIWSSIVTFLFFFTCAGQGIAGVDVWESYNPKDDPNLALGPSKGLAVQGEVIWKLVEAFQKESIPRAERRQVVAQWAPPQPDHYTRETPPVEPQEPVYADPYDYPYGPYSPYGPLYRRWHERSPRVPWRSLVPFVREDRHFPFAQPHPRGSRFD